MKTFITTLLLNIVCIAALCQRTDISFEKYPFKMEVLQRLTDKKDSIMPTYTAGQFQYIDTRTHTTVFEKTFEVAYPFDGRNAAVIKSGDKFGIIDRTGHMLVEPQYSDFQFWDTPFNENLVFFNAQYRQAFDLNRGIFITPSNGCRKPLIIWPFGIVFKENNKYGIESRKPVHQNKEEHLIPPTFDSIYLITPTMFIGRRGNNFVLLDSIGKKVLPGDYKDLIISRAINDHSYPRIIGLKSGEEWEYYSLNEPRQLFLKSRFKCRSIGEVKIKNAFGIYNEHGKDHVLFTDNRIMKDSYDWISDNGTLGITNDAVYIIGEDGNSFLYYKK